MKPGELERRLARLASMAEEAKRRLDELGRNVSSVRSTIDELAASCKVAGAGEAGNGTSDPEAAQVEAAFK